MSNASSKFENVNVLLCHFFLYRSGTMLPRPVTYASTKNFRGWMSCRHDNNRIVSHRPLNRVEAKRLLKAALIDAADNSNPQSQQDETASDSLPMEPPQQEVVKRCREVTFKRLQHITFYTKYKGHAIRISYLL